MEVRGVPFTLVGKDSFNGWLDAATTGAALEAAVQFTLAHPGADVLRDLTLPGKKRRTRRNILKASWCTEDNTKIRAGRQA